MRYKRPMVSGKKLFTPQPLKLNLGCGSDHQAGYLNVDVDPAAKPDLIHDLYQPLPFPKNAVQKILLQDVLEHFTLEDGRRLLMECQRVLQIGGELKIRLPNLQVIFDKYRSQPDLLALFLYGDTSRNGVWGAHKVGHTPASIRRLLLGAQLRLSKWWIEDTNYVMELHKEQQLHQVKFNWAPGAKPRLLARKSGNEKIIPDQNFRLVGLNERPSHLFCNSWLSICLTPLWRWQGYQVIWQPPASSSLLINLVSKLYLRHLVGQVEWIVTNTKQTAKFATEMLRFSHLRVIAIATHQKSKSSKNKK